MKMQIPNWIARDTGAFDLGIDKKYLTYGLIAGAGLALIAPNKFKTAGIALAVISGGLLVANTPTA